MTGVYVELSYIDLAIASVLLLLAGGLSVALNLGLEKVWASPHCAPRCNSP